MDNKGADPELVKLVAKLKRFLQAGKIDFDEFASNVIVRLLDYGYDSVEVSLKQLDGDELSQLSNYAREYFKGNAFRPHPVIFMIDTNDPQKVAAKREELKPKYEALLSHIEKCERAVKKSDG